MQLFANFSESGVARAGANIQCASAAHTVITGDNTFGYFDVSINFDAPFPDANYAIATAVEYDGDTTQTADIHVGAVSRSASGVNARVFCGTGGTWIGKTVNVHIVALHP
jgi:hypothetical protein